MIVVSLLVAGCSTQVAGMQSPVFHDYGPIEWIPLDRQIEQRFIAGSGYSAAIQNDQGTTPEEYVDRLGELSDDATDGELVELRLALRVEGQPAGEWSTGAMVQVTRAGPPAEGSPTHPGLQQFVYVDSLPRSGDMVILDDVPDVGAGEIVSIVLLPGDGPQSTDLQVAVTPHRAPYAGWRAMSDDEPLVGALVFETRYQREVDLAGVVGSAGERLASSGGFLTMWVAVATAVLAGTVALGAKQRREATDGR